MAGLVAALFATGCGNDGGDALPKPQGMHFSQESYEVRPEESLRLSVRITLAGVESDYDLAANAYEVELTSSDPSVATVSDDGTITGVGYGTTTLTGRSAQFGQPFTATVHVWLEGLRFESEQYAMALGGWAAPRLLVTEDAAETQADNRRFDITWRIEDPAVAMLSDDGRVQGLRAGTTTLVASTPYYPEEVSTRIEVGVFWTGEWMLVRVGGNDAMSGTVYIALESDKTFTLYQSIDVAGFTILRGTYQVSSKEGKNVLSGVYDDGVAWASEYEVSREGDDLFLTALADGRMVSQYLRTEIPDHVKDGVTGAPALGVQRSAGRRFL